MRQRWEKGIFDDTDQMVAEEIFFEEVTHPLAPFMLPTYSIRHVKRLSEDDGQNSIASRDPNRPLMAPSLE